MVPVKAVHSWTPPLGAGIGVVPLLTLDVAPSHPVARWFAWQRIGMNEGIRANWAFRRSLTRTPADVVLLVVEAANPPMKCRVAFELPAARPFLENAARAGWIALTIPDEAGGPDQARIRLVAAGATAVADVLLAATGVAPATR